MSAKQFCAAVESYECEAPPGYRVGSIGYAVGEGKTHLHKCAYCEERVCAPCSTQVVPPSFLKMPEGAKVRVCLSHNEEELYWWLGLDKKDVNV